MARILIMTGGAICGAGFYFYIDAFQRSTDFTANDGAIRVGLACALVGVGAFIAAMPFML